VANDPAGQQQLRNFGARTVPVLAKGDQYIFCQDLENVAEFVGLQGTGHTPLPPAALIAKWTVVLRAAQRYLRQLPDQRLGQRAIETRDRSIRLLSHHIFRIGEAFLEVVIDGVEYQAQLANVPPEDGTFMTAEELAGYGDAVIERLKNWWARLDDKSCRQKVKTFYGTPPMHQLFERSTWHSAQHVRQLSAVLERFGITPDGGLTAEDLGGLPLPERVWD
jgi:DinB superfamily